MRGKGYSIGIPLEPQLCTEFLPSDKSSRQVTEKQEGQWRDKRVKGRKGALLNLALYKMGFYKNGNPVFIVVDSLGLLLSLTLTASFL